MGRGTGMKMQGFKPQPSSLPAAPFPSRSLSLLVPRPVLTPPYAERWAVKRARLSQDTDKTWPILQHPHSSLDSSLPRTGRVAPEFRSHRPDPLLGGNFSSSPETKRSVPCGKSKQGAALGIPRPMSISLASHNGPVPGAEAEPGVGSRWGPAHPPLLSKLMAGWR